jgi:spore germination protein GerM
MRIGGVRWRVADNTNTPPEILTLLAQDEDVYVRQRVERNPNYNQEVDLKTQLKALKTHIAAVQYIIDNIHP